MWNCPPLLNIRDGGGGDAQGTLKALQVALTKVLQMRREYSALFRLGSRRIEVSLRVPIPLQYMANG